MRLLGTRQDWTGFVGLARVLVLVCATWTFAAALTGATGAKLFFPSSLMIVGLAFIAGHATGRKGQ